ncbi:hypothetical protein [Methanolobus bombayensis]|nr:hypothetical protein [Methanolobus bombayensis]MBP1910260.1 hypothetical protein [Methanolobus bombayensis]
MSKFHKRDYERKGEKKYEELDAKLIQENLEDLISPEGEKTD